MEVQHFKTLKEAIEHLTANDKNYILVRHTFPAGKIIKPHMHPDVNEWVILDAGEIEFSLDGEKQVVKPTDIVAVLCPQRKFHSVRCISDVSYLVIRDGPSETVYTKQI